MSGVVATLTTAEVALTAATQKCIIQAVAASNHPIKLQEWGVYFDGVSSSAEPVVVELFIPSGAGTMSSLTPIQASGPTVTLQTTGLHTATAEPGSSGVIQRVNVHPQSGYEKIYTPGAEPVAGSGIRLGIRCTAPAGVNVVGYMKFEE